MKIVIFEETWDDPARVYLLNPRFEFDGVTGDSTTERITVAIGVVGYRHGRVCTVTMDGYFV